MSTPTASGRQQEAHQPPGAPATPSVDGYRTAPDHENTGWPPGVPYIVANEVCERFSFYGMRAILQVHLTALFAVQAYVQSRQEARTFATQTFHLFMAGTYALPMIGALVADRWAGKYKTIFYLSLFYCAGHAVLSLYENQVWGMYLGLALIAIGAGGIKPCISANVGDQFGKKNLNRIGVIYQIFYFSVNFGSFFATLLIPILRAYSGAWVKRLFPGTFDGIDDLRLGTSIAFGLPGVLMFLAALFFWMGRKKFVHVPPKPGGRIGLLDACCSTMLFLTAGHLFFTRELVAKRLAESGHAEYAWPALGAISLAFFAAGLVLFVIRQRLAPDDGFLAITLHVLKRHLGLGAPEPTPLADSPGPLSKSWFWRPGVERFGEEATEGPVAVFKIISVFLLVSVFWALFDQHSSTWITQAAQMDLRLWANLDSFLGIGNFTLQASQTSAMNPFMVMLFIPMMNVVYGLFDRVGLKTTPLRRLTVGLFVTALSFVATALLQQYIDRSPPKTVWIGWQAVQYVLLTIGEVLVSITGLEFAYTQAPRRMKSTVMGFWLLTTALGNVLVAFLAGIQKPMTRWFSENVASGLSNEATFFWVFAILSAIAAVLFGVRAAFYKPKSYAQG